MLLPNLHFREKYLLNNPVKKIHCWIEGRDDLYWICTKKQLGWGFDCLNMVLLISDGIVVFQMISSDHDGPEAD